MRPVTGLLVSGAEVLNGKCCCDVHTKKLPILYFEPIYKEKIWGGSKIGSHFSRPAAPERNAGESWEISACVDSVSMVAQSKLKGVLLSTLFEENPEKLAGVASEKASLFPLLIKFIDANDNLSVQVHPDDYHAAQYGFGKNGKTECWYIVDAEKEAKCIVGFNKDVSRDEVLSHIARNTLSDIVNTIPVKKGDLLFVPGGCVHAICKGCLLYEVQQTSDTTFRLYDWGRVDSNGTSRVLHLEDALRVLTTGRTAAGTITPLTVRNDARVVHRFRMACTQFAIEEYVLQPDTVLESLPPKKSMQILTVLEGVVHTQVEGQTEMFSAGQTFLIPAAHASVVLKTLHMQSTFLVTTIPDLKNEVITPLRNLAYSDRQIAALGGSDESNSIRSLL